MYRHRFLVLFFILTAVAVWVLIIGLSTTISMYKMQLGINPADIQLPKHQRPVLLDGVWHLPALLNSTSNSTVSDFGSIPRILHQAFESEMVYENYLPMIRSCLAANPDWDYYLWRDSDAKAFIGNTYPKFLSKYTHYRDNLERSDSIRYLVLHHFGGIYLDMDVECRRSFLPALSRLPAFLDQERTEQSNIMWSMPYSAMNSVMGSVPGHPFFSRMLTAMHNHQRTGNAFDSTGPRLLTHEFVAYMRKQSPSFSPSPSHMPLALMEPRVFSPLMDSQNDWRRRCRWISGMLPRFGCRTLEAKKWSMDDTDDATLAVHRFLHLGYSFKKRSRRPKVNVSVVFPNRVKFYGRDFFGA